METIKLNKEGEFKFPKEFQGFKQLRIRIAWRCTIFNGDSVMNYFRQKGKDKPYVAEDIVEFTVGGKVTEYKLDKSDYENSHE